MVAMMANVMDRKTAVPSVDLGLLIQNFRKGENLRRRTDAEVLDQCGASVYLRFLDRIVGLGLRCGPRSHVALHGDAEHRIRRRS
jgi:hypothetical protein